MSLIEFSRPGVESILWDDVELARHRNWLAKGGFTEGWVWDV